jgi:hypothetical protein
VAGRTDWSRGRLGTRVFEEVETLQGPERGYWIWLDEPQDDGSGDGPYRAATILGCDLEVLADEEDAVFLVTYLAGRLLYYAVMEIVELDRPPPGGPAPWMLVLPDGLVRAVERPSNGEKVLRDTANGGPSYLTPFTASTGGIDRPLCHRAGERRNGTGRHSIGERRDGGEPALRL